MRILRLTAEGWSVELHPYVTVVAGLTEEQRGAVGAAFQSAIRGRTTELGGLLEVHGVVLDLDAGSLSLLGLDDVEVDAIVEPSDLPGAASTGMDRQLRAAERRVDALEGPYREHARAAEAAAAALDEARTALDEARAAAALVDDADQPDDELPRLEEEVRVAEAALDELAEPGSRAAGELEQAERALAGLADDETGARNVELATARRAHETRRAALAGALDPDAADAFEAALAQLRSLESPAAPARAEVHGGPDAGEDHDDTTRAARVEELRGILALHASFDPSELRSALDAIRLTPHVGELVPSTEALSLADRLEVLDRRIAELEVGSAEAPVPGDLEAAAVELDEIRSSIIELERTSGSSNLEADIAELERAHEELVRSRERLGGRLGRGRLQARYEDALAAEEAVLDRLGIRTYTDYLTGGRAALYADAEPAQLRRLRSREREAEVELRSLETRAGHAIELAAAGQDRRELRGRARTLLGDAALEDHELTRALLALRVPAERSSPLDELLDALEAVGLPVRTLDLSRDDAEAMAADWLDEYHRSEDRRAALEAELTDLEAGASHGAGPTPAEAIPSDPAGAQADEESATGEADDQPVRLAAAQAAVREAKDRMITHESAMRELADLDVELEALEGEERDTGESRQLADEVRRRVEEARATVASLDAARAAAEARVVQGRATLDQQRAAPSARIAEASVAVAAAEQHVSQAVQSSQTADAELDAARAAYDAAVEEVAGLRHALAGVAEDAAPVEEIEWYLLARLAAQRQVSFAGSVPIVIDRALDAVDDAGVVHLLERLERMAGAVQVVHLSDDERIIGWAQVAGDDRVAVVRPAVPSIAD